MNENRAITLCLKHRDPAGFEYLVNAYRREAYGHALAILGNRDDALDACQDCFAKAFAVLPRLNRLTEFYPWFYRILRNHCLNMISRRQTRDAYAQRETVQGSAGGGASPDDIFMGNEKTAAVRTALAGLAPDQREILAMKYFDEMSYDRMAAVLGIPRGTVMSRLYHARKALRAACERHLER